MKKIAVILLCFCLLQFSFLAAFAKTPNENNSNGDAVISTTVPDYHKLTVKVSTDGSAYVYLNGETNDSFGIERLSEPSLEINTAKDYEISKVVLNGKDITNEVINGKYKLSPVYEDLLLEIETKAIPNTDVSSNTSGDTSSNTSSTNSNTSSDSSGATSTNTDVNNTNNDVAKTGDSRNLGAYMILLSLSLIAIFAVVKYKHSNED